jgi:2-(1,2-epoxy-1,2-dihydrophenyl)acetyl-CoA isomerase
MSFILTRVENQIATITLNRPDKLNAFAGTMREDLLGALRAADADAGCRVVVITGAGRAFCSGGDLEWMAALREREDVAGLRKLLDAGQAVVVQIADMNKPVLAAVNGVAAGAGCNLALACDYRLASDQARFSESFVKVGLHPDWGGTWLLPRLVGRSRALELMMTGRIVEAAEALAIGMVDRLVPSDELPAETEKLAGAIAAGPPVAVSGIKAALRRSERNALGAQVELESEHQRRAFQSKDAEEGIKAFFEKRAPRFTGQ